VHLIVGLGNPGQKYADTRHNAGFMALDALARRCGFDPPVNFKHSLISKGRIEGRPVVLAWPQTFMNLSGEAVLELASFYKIPGEDILVLHDELDLEPGRLKMVYGGGTAGHKGLASILAMLRQDFCRLKIGIGRPPKEIFVNGNVDYVLGRFLDLEWPAVEASLTAAAEAAVDWLSQGLVKAQNQVNKRQKKLQKDQKKLKEERENPAEEVCETP